MTLAGNRILIYSIHYAPELTGVGRYSGEIAVELACCGAAVDVIAAPPHYPEWQVSLPWRNRYARERRDGVRIVRCPLYLGKHVRGIVRLLAPLGFTLASLPVAIWKLILLRPHVMILVEPTLMPAPIVGIVARLIGTRAILHVQDLEIDGAFEVGHLKGGALKNLALAFERLALNLFDRVITISNTMRARLIEKGVRDTKIALVRNWVDLDAISPLPDPNAYRAVLDIAPDLFVVQYSGSVGAKQALGLLCEAAELLREREDICFVIAGQGPDRQRLEADYGYLPNLRFFDFQPEESLCAFLNMADVHVIPQLATSADFALPSKLGGILASGRRLLVTADQDQELSDFLGSAAHLVPPGDARKLAQSIVELAAATVDDTRAQRLELARQLSRTRALSAFVNEVAREANQSRIKVSKGE